MRDKRGSDFKTKEVTSLFSERNSQMSMYFDHAVQIRRRLHAKPELGWGEFVTMSLIIKELESLGFKLHLGYEQVARDCVMGRNESFVRQNIERALTEGVTQAEIDRMQEITGCVAQWDTGRPGPVTALRFDIDCVQVDESDEPTHAPCVQGFRSTHKGCMHACGHDGHTAVGLAVARFIHDNTDKLTGCFKLFFQPAEEGVRGAVAQAASGLLDDADYLLGSHLGLQCKSGEVCSYPQNVLPTTKLDAIFTGRPAHPTMSPELGRNALACACTCVSELMGMAHHGKGFSSINVGRIEAGEIRNVIPVHGLIQLEVRGETGEINDYMVDQAKCLIEGTAQAYRVDVVVKKAGESTELINDMELVELLEGVANETAGVKKVVRQSSLGASEDFSIMARRVHEKGGKSEFFIVGTDHPGAHHQKNFDLDEKSLDIAIDLFTGCLLKLNGK